MDVIETTLLRGKVKLLQPKVGFHASLDTVFLGAAVPLKDHFQVLDIGCGVGSAGLCAALRNQSMHLTGIDIQADLIDLAHQNGILNKMSDRSRFFCADISSEKVIENNYFHSVLANPPYQPAGTYIPPSQKITAISHGEDGSGITLEKLAKYAHSKLKNGFHFTMIHRSDRLDEIVNILTRKKWFGSLEIIPFWPHEGEAAKRVIIRARKERYKPLTLHAGMVIHKADGSYTEAAKDILEKAAPIQ